MPRAEMLFEDRGDAGRRLAERLAPDDDLVARYAAGVTAWLEGLEVACAAEQTAYARVSTAWGVDDLTVALLHERGVVA